MVVKIYEVAQVAGVSVATVSRVFNNYPDVSEETRLRVRAAANQLGYVPNVAARTLSSKSLNNVALILNEVTRGREDVIGMQLIDGVYQYATSHDIGFVLYMTNAEIQKRKTFDQFCLERNITGTVVQGLSTDDPFICQIENSEIPVVSVDLEIPGHNTGSISINNQEAERVVTERMIQQGRKHLIMINGWANAEVSQSRQQGFLQAFESLGYSPLEYTIQYADFDQQQANTIARRLMIEHPEIDGFICASDGMAIGVLKAVQALGMRVPEQVMVAGFDNTIASQYLTPSLSTVEQHMDRMGNRAAKMVVDLINHRLPRDHAKRRLYTSYEYIQRRSTNFGGSSKLRNGQIFDKGETDET
ncbi:LacI family DNA-binding transcriptional regulator [Lacticaseibacillus nasuensis]|uniref:LacI family DNA-binding transcriptional regulator n=1 Tax=Lacticaseibacillus nasuensis TaxID=944671 RepID=UPI00138F27BB|nr:LacI family DNA-binding transcriptional regulator [Lacticaseibacillus nasuensis]